MRHRPASAFVKLSQSKASDSDSALGTAGERVNLSRRQWGMHQDVKGSVLCLSNPTSRNITKRELSATVKKQAQEVCPELFLLATNDNNLTVHQWRMVQ